METNMPIRTEERNAMSAINSVTAVPYNPPITVSSATSSSTPTGEGPGVEDAIELSLAGRIALGVGDGLLTGDQGLQLESQLKAVNQQIQSGGAGVDIGQLQSQLSQQIYGDGHNGATIPTDLTVTPAEDRDFLQAGRIVTQESAGNLTSNQASQFFSQIGQIYQQSQSGATAAVTNQAQNRLSAEIYDAAHATSGPLAS